MDIQKTLNEWPVQCIVAKRQVQVQVDASPKIIIKSCQRFRVCAHVTVAFGAAVEFDYAVSHNQTVLTVAVNYPVDRLPHSATPPCAV